MFLELGKAIKENENDAKSTTTKQYAEVIGPILCKDQEKKFTDQQANVLNRLIEEFEPNDYA